MDVVFFPRNDYPNNVEVCSHRLGKKMTHCEATTEMPTLVQSKMLPYIESKFQSDGIRVCGIFKSNYKQSAWNTEYGKSLIARNIIWPDLYFFPINYTDYSEQSVMAAWAIEQPWFIEQFGRKPELIDFSQGNTSYRQYVARYLFAYMNIPSFPYNNTNYGMGVGNPSNIPYSHFYGLTLNNRVFDRATGDNENYATYINQMSSLIDATLALPKGGFTFNFSHWHDLINLDYNSDGTPKEGRNDKALNAFKSYIDMLAQKNANKEIYFAGAGEAVAYLVYRESISKAVMYSPNAHRNDQLVIRLEAKNVFNIDTDLLQVPISIKFSTANTPLASQTIRCNYNLISFGNNQYIVEIPYSEYPGAVIEKVN